MAGMVAEAQLRSDVVTLAVLGDSTAAGIGDPLGDGRFRGFGPLLARAMGEPRRVRFVTTAQSGARVRCVLRDQLPVAVQARPDLAVLIVGINDTLRSDFAPTELHDDLSGIVAALTATGATVLTVRYHHHGRVFPLPPFLARALDNRIDALNDVIDRVVRDHGARCLDLAALPACYEPGVWSVDRLHPSERGHRLLARGFADLLLAAGHQIGDLAWLDGTDGRAPTRVEEAHWLLTQGVPWVFRRGRDLVPFLLGAASRRARAVR